MIMKRMLLLTLALLLTACGAGDEAPDDNGEQDMMEEGEMENDADPNGGMDENGEDEEMDEQDMGMDGNGANDEIRDEAEMEDD